MPPDLMQLLERYVVREGNALIPKAHVEDGFALGQRVAKRRFAYQQGGADAERSSRLEELPGWSWTPQDDQWQDAYDRLLRFVEREGHAFVRQDVIEDGLRLGIWVWEQRRAYEQGRLPPERAFRLEALTGWAWDALAARWDQHYANLLAFVRRTGHARVPHRSVEDEAHLGEWVHSQRRSYRSGRLPADRITRLDDAAWVVVGTRELNQSCGESGYALGKANPLRRDLPQSRTAGWTFVGPPACAA